MEANVLLSSLDSPSRRIRPQEREYFRVKSSISEQEFTNFYSKFGFVNSPAFRSEFFWLDTGTDPTAARLFRTSSRLRIKRRDNNFYRLQYKTPVLPRPANDFLYKTFEEQKWPLGRSIAQKIISRGHALSTEFPGSYFPDVVRFEVIAISTSEKQTIRQGDLKIIIERFQTAVDLCRHYQLEIRSLNPVSVLRFKARLEQEVGFRKPVSKLMHIWASVCRWQ